MWGTFDLVEFQVVLWSFDVIVKNTLRLLVEQIKGTFVLVVFKVIFASFDALISK